MHPVIDEKEDRWVAYDEETTAQLQENEDDDEFSSDIDELYETCNDTKNTFASEPKKNHLSNVISKIYKKHAWFNKATISKEYESIDSDIIPALSLVDLNDSAFIKQYEYYTGKFKEECHWLIPNLLLIGADPGSGGVARYLVKDGFNIFISLHEWKHDWYRKSIEAFAKDMNHMECIAFTIRDFNVADDHKTVTFIDKLVQKILTMNSNSSQDNDEKEENVVHHKIYMHCLGGHGRTGLISGLLLQAIYGMDSETAIKFINQIHLARHPYCGTNRMPESMRQRKQVQRLHGDMIQIHHKYIKKKQK